MSDVYCRYCGEPFALDEFHNGTNSYDQLKKLFFEYGCPIADGAIEGLSPLQIPLTKCDRKPVDEPMELFLLGLENDDDVNW